MVLDDAGVTTMETEKDTARKATPEKATRDGAKRRVLNTFGKREKALRDDVGMTQEELIAEMDRRFGIKVSQGYLSKLENSSAFPGGEMVAVFARALRTTSDYLLLLTDDKRPIDVQVESAESSAFYDDMIRGVVEIMRQVSPAMRHEILAAATALHRQDELRKESNQSSFERLLGTAEHLGGEEMRRVVAQKLRLASTPDDGVPQSGQNEASSN
jgi:transcriptional regulator with XRE-family HTH domain